MDTFSNRVKCVKGTVMPHLDRNTVIRTLEKTGVIGVIRAESSEELLDISRALRDGGVVASEITMTTPNALDAIATVNAKLGDDCLIGVGSVLDPETARAAILAAREAIIKKAEAAVQAVRRSRSKATRADEGWTPPRS